MEGRPAVLPVTDLQYQFATAMGAAYLGDALDVLKCIDDASVNLIMTSPPFALKRKKEYGNVRAEEYVDWFGQFVPDFRRVLAPDGSIVIDIGGTWNKGEPTRSLYHFELLISLCRDHGLMLAQEFFWYNPSKLPAPAEWVNIRRIRVKDSVNTIWWLSKQPFPKANNRRVLKPYSDSMEELLERGYDARLRPSGHDISGNFAKRNGGAIPPNLLEIANTDSNSAYLQRCREEGIPIHPARFPADLPRFFINFLTEPGDLVLDPFAGSNVTGATAEEEHRRWIAIELSEEYLAGARFRFDSVVGG